MEARHAVGLQVQEARGDDGAAQVDALDPELPSALPLITSLLSSPAHHHHHHHPSPTIISLGHSTAPYATGLAALHAGATALTHTFNAMAALHHREPGLAGLMGHSVHRPYYSVIADGVHLHAAVLRMAVRTDPARCIVITDAVELAGLPDGIYPGNGQIAQRQRKVGGWVTLVRDERHDEENDKEDEEGGEREDEILIGSCSTLDSCIANMVELAGCTLAEAVRCATENVAGLMGERGRGVLEPGRRADFAVLDPPGGGGGGGGGGGVRVRETWVAGLRVFVRKGEEGEG